MCAINSARPSASVSTVLSSSIVPGRLPVTLTAVNAEPVPRGW